MAHISQQRYDLTVVRRLIERIDEDVAARERFQCRVQETCKIRYRQLTLRYQVIVRFQQRLNFRE